MKRPIQNLPASIRQRLLDRARVSDRPFNELLQYYSMERFLYRLSVCSLMETIEGKRPGSSPTARHGLAKSACANRA